MSETTYYQRERDVMLNRVKDYYKSDKERLRDNARDKCRNLYEEEKNEKREMEEIDFTICLKKSKRILGKLS